MPKLRGKFTGTRCALYPIFPRFSADEHKASATTGALAQDIDRLSLDACHQNAPAEITPVRSSYVRQKPSPVRARPPVESGRFSVLCEDMDGDGGSLSGPASARGANANSEAPTHALANLPFDDAGIAQYQQRLNNDNRHRTEELIEWAGQLLDHLTQQNDELE